MRDLNYMKFDGQKFGPLFSPLDEDLFQHDWFKQLEPAVVDAFKIFHAQHQGLFDLYVKYARDLKAAGKLHYGLKSIAERVRWHLTVEHTGTEGEQFKINNNFSSCYARLMMLKYPEFDGMFELRSSHREIEL